MSTASDIKSCSVPNRCVVVPHPIMPNVVAKTTNQQKNLWGRKLRSLEPWGIREIGMSRGGIRDWKLQFGKILGQKFSNDASSHLRQITLFSSCRRNSKRNRSLCLSAFNQTVYEVLIHLDRFSTADIIRSHWQVRQPWQAWSSLPNGTTQ